MILNRTNIENSEGLILVAMDGKLLPSAAACYAAAYSSSDDSEQMSAQDVLDYLEYCYRRQPDVFFVILENNTVVGGMFGVIKPAIKKWSEGSHVLYETDIFVHPSYQGKGLSKVLFRAVLNVAKEKYAVRDFEAIADSALDFPMSFYKKLGMKSTGWVEIRGNVDDMLHSL